MLSALNPSCDAISSLTLFLNEQAFFNDSAAVRKRRKGERTHGWMDEMIEREVDVKR